MNDLQGTLFELEALPEEEVAEKEQITYERRKPSEKSDHSGRNPLPEHLPVEDITMLHSKADTDTMIHIGMDISQRLSIKPAQLFVKRYLYPKYKDPATGIIY